MSSLKKVEANRRNAQLSTGPRTPEGKAKVSVNAITHGLRATKHLLYFERYVDFNQICHDLTAEWLPSTPTEAALVEQMAIAQAKLVRLESNLSQTFYQSDVLRFAGCEDEFTDADGTVRPPPLILERELKVQRLINGLSQHIARVERAWHKALDTLQKLQDRRRKEEARAPESAEEDSPQPPAQETGPETAPAPRESTAINAKMNDQSQISPRKGVDQPEQERTSCGLPSDPEGSASPAGTSYTHPEPYGL